MSNYLTRLVPRLLGVAPLVQPNVPSRFEPVRWSGQIGPLLQEIEDRREVLQGVVKPDSLSAAGHAVAPPVAMTSESYDMPNHHVVPPVSLSIPRDEKLPVMARPARRVSEPVKTRAESPGDSAQTDRAEERSSSLGVLGRRVDERLVPPVDPMSPLQAKPPFHGPSRADQLRAEASEPDRPFISRLTPTIRLSSDALDALQPLSIKPTERIQPASNAIAQGTVWPARSSSIEAMQSKIEPRQPLPLEHPSDTRENATIGPTIHVSIGRIEVRATLASGTKPPQPREKPPTLGLDEYLRQRDEGGRK